MKLLLIALFAGALALGAAPVAGASQLVGRNATAVKLAADDNGAALLTYRSNGKLIRVLAVGATNARTPTTGVAQVAFKLDYSGGRGVFRNTCKPVVQVVQWQVAACQARDGSYWALQSWQRALPNYGVTPNAAQAAWELRLSHWTGALAEFNVGVDWAYGGKFDHLFGTLTYQSMGVFGFKATARGVPLDTYGRNVYLDTFNSAYGSGWMRENSFLTHAPNGSFCNGFFAHGSRPAGKGARYRITVIGPGVTPDVYWEGAAPGTYDPTRDKDADGLQRQLLGRDAACPPR
jgi:hypothetical protein